MIPLLTAGEMRHLDDYTIGTVGVPGAALMETAGRAVFEHLWSTFGDRAVAEATVVVCGRGNNGGDGFVVARCLENRGCRVEAVLLGRRDEVHGDAAVHLTAYLGSGGVLREVVSPEDEEAAAAAVRGASLLVDAVLGTGLAEDVRGLPARAIGWLDLAHAPVVSVDIPSGVSSDSGRVCGAAVRADLTVTFQWPKRGHFLHPGAARTGRLEVVDIGVPPPALGRVEPGLWCAEDDDFVGALARRADAHKGVFGHVLVLGGSTGKSGAPGLAAWGALRAGAGLATVVAPWGCLSAARLPLEVMTAPLGGGPECREWAEGLWEEAAGSVARASALVVGPGMGTGPGAKAFLGRLLTADGSPAVLDADALNLVASDPDLWRARRRQTVLTPHPGEASRLLGSSAAAVQADRVGAARELVERFRCPVVLKGAGTLVAEPEAPVILIPVGNPGMATAGTGDVLAGVMGAFLGRGIPPGMAARMAAYVHGVAGDLAAAAQGEEGLLAGDVVSALPEAVRQIAGGGPLEPRGERAT
jgi:NAD(P)H-hydrate epimerase